MFKSLSLIACIATPAMSQVLTQTVRGTVIDTDSNIPLTGVQIIVVDSDPLKGTVTDIDVDTENNRYYDYQKAYETSLDDIHTVTLSASYKWNKPRTTHEIFLNIDNATNSKSCISEFYNESAPNSIGYVTQSFFYPNLIYKVYC